MNQSIDSIQSVDGFGVARFEDCLRAPCYCEENVWQLCKAIRDRNEIPLWHQKAGSYDNDGFVLWDYHVILLRPSDISFPKSMIYDLDTTLAFPCSFEEYFTKAIRHDHSFKQEYQRKYRIIEAATYLDRFGSDRSHMINEETGDWFRPPPPWPCILNAQGTNTIEKFWSMDVGNSENELNDVSEVIDTRRLIEKYSPISPSN